MEESSFSFLSSIVCNFSRINPYDFFQRKNNVLKIAGEAGIVKAALPVRGAPLLHFYNQLGNNLVYSCLADAMLQPLCTGGCSCTRPLQHGSYCTIIGYTVSYKH